MPVVGSAQQVALTDLDGDGRHDVVVHQTCGAPGCRPVVGHPSLPCGGFGPPIDLLNDSPQGSDSLLAQDMDGDGRGDVLASGWVQERSLGGGAFSPNESVTSLSTQNFDERAFFDVNRDGLMDVLARVSGSFGVWQLLRQTPAHAFVAEAEISLLHGKMALPGDVDRDGAADRMLSWAALAAPAQVLTLLGDDTGALRSSWVDGGLLDLVTTTTLGGSLSAAPLSVNLATAPAVWTPDPGPRVCHQAAPSGLRAGPSVRPCLPQLRWAPWCPERAGGAADQEARRGEGSRPRTRRS